MKLARKMVFGLLSGIIVVLALSAWLRVVREVDLFDGDMERDDLLVGRAVAMAVKRAWEAQGEAAALAFVRSFNVRSHVNVRWVSLDNPPPPGSAPLLPLPELSQVGAGAELSRRDDQAGVQLTYVPLTIAGLARPGALELSESLEAERDYVRRSISNAAITTLAFIAVAAVLASILGGYFVGRPVHQLVEKVRRIATGDLARPVSLRRKDELGELAGAINQMCDALSAANEAEQQATAARLAAVEQLRHADRLTTVGRLASGIAHELGTPLNIVAGRGFMIATKEATGDEALENARIIVEQTERMTQTIRQLLDFARPRPVEKTDADLRVVASTTVSLLRPMAEKRGVQLFLAEDDTPGRAVADPAQIQQVITNLVVNAIDATGKGGTVTIGFHSSLLTPPGRQGQSPGPPAPYLCVKVTDTGQGMDPETQARIFDPFFTTKDVGAGTGLGLSIAYGIVHDHGGWIEVKSQPGRGTTMTIYLPRGAQEVTA
jgi:signal transduction histidine kinase